MEDLQQLGARLLQGKNGEALRALADSPEAKRLGAALDGAETAAALRAGDEEALAALLRGVLATAEGKALAEKLSALDKQP